MMTMTTSSSMSVKPWRVDELMGRLVFMVFFGGWIFLRLPCEIRRV
jgi:hypothetical protein